MQVWQQESKVCPSVLTPGLERYFVWIRRKPQGLTRSLERAHVSGHRPSNQPSLLDPFLFGCVVHGEMGESYDSSPPYAGYVILLTKTVKRTEQSGGKAKIPALRMNVHRQDLRCQPYLKLRLPSQFIKSSGNANASLLGILRTEIKDQRQESLERGYRSPEETGRTFISTKAY